MAWHEHQSHFPQTRIGTTCHWNIEVTLIWTRLYQTIITRWICIHLTLWGPFQRSTVCLSDNGFDVTLAAVLPTIKPQPTVRFSMKSANWPFAKTLCRSQWQSFYSGWNNDKIQIPRIVTLLLPPLLRTTVYRVHAEDARINSDAHFFFYPITALRDNAWSGKNPDRCSLLLLRHILIPPRHIKLIPPLRYLSRILRTPGIVEGIRDNEDLLTA